MRTRPFCNVSHPIRWNVEAAGREFDWHFDTLKKKLIQAEQIPAADGSYSTKQICCALFGDIASERLRKTREEADHMALKNAVLRCELLPKALITQAMENIFVTIRQLIEASSMSTIEKKDLMDAIFNWPVAVRNVEQKVTKEIKFAKAAEENGENGSEAAD